MAMLVEAPAAVEDALASVLDHPAPLVPARPPWERPVGGISRGGCQWGWCAGAQDARPDPLVQVDASSLWT